MSAAQWTQTKSWAALNGLKAVIEYEYEPADHEVGIMSDDYIINRVCVTGVNGVDIAELLTEAAIDALENELREYIESEREAAREQAGEERGIRIAEWYAMALQSNDVK